MMTVGSGVLGLQTIVLVAGQQIASGRPRRHRRGMALFIGDLEVLAANGWRAPEEERLRGWLLRAARGFTVRANSALAAGDPGIPPAEAVLAVRRWYAERKLPAMIAVPYPLGRPATVTPSGSLASTSGASGPTRRW
jgi:hypothetical protein